MKVLETLYLCRRDCCPEMHYDSEEGYIIITDDFKDKIKLTVPQFELLKKAFEKRFTEVTLDA